jgi:hypothetical protein
MEDGNYEGWTNYATWCVALWLGNEEATYRQIQRLARQAWDDAPRSREMKSWKWPREDAAICILGHQLQGFVEEQNTVTGTTLYADLMNAALSNVQWFEIAADCLADELERAEREQGGKR